MAALEAIGQMYLTKLRQTAGVKQLIERNWSRQDWQDVGQGSEAVEAQLKLSGSQLGLARIIEAGLIRQQIAQGANHGR